MCEDLIRVFSEALEIISETEANDYAHQAPAMLEYVNQCFEQRKDLLNLIGITSVDVMHTNHANHVEFMEVVFRVKSAVALVNVVAWVYNSYISRGFNSEYFVVELQFWKEAILKYVRLGQPGAIIRVYEIMAENHLNFLKLSEHSDSLEPVDERARPQFDKFVAAILKPSSAEAMAFARDSIQSVDDVKFWWYKVIRPAMYEIGRLWSLGEITVAREHLATSITQRIMAAFYPMILDLPRNKGKVIFTASPGELHEIGPRMMADLLEIEGWDVLYTGADTPAGSLIDLLKTENARFLCISTTLPTNLTNTSQLVASVRADIQTANVNILVGGQAYNLDPTLWQKVGADRYANSTEAAVTFLESCSDK